MPSSSAAVSKASASKASAGKASAGKTSAGKAPSAEKSAVGTEQPLPDSSTSGLKEPAKEGSGKKVSSVKEASVQASPPKKKASFKAPSKASSKASSKPPAKQPPSSKRSPSGSRASTREPSTKEPPAGETSPAEKPTAAKEPPAEPAAPPKKPKKHDPAFTISEKYGGWGDRIRHRRGLSTPVFEGELSPRRSPVRPNNYYWDSSHNSSSSSGLSGMDDPETPTYVEESRVECCAGMAASTDATKAFEKAKKEAKDAAKQAKKAKTTEAQEASKKAAEDVETARTSMQEANAAFKRLRKQARMAYRDGETFKKREKKRMEKEKRAQGKEDEKAERQRRRELVQRKKDALRPEANKRKARRAENQKKPSLSTTKIATDETESTKLGTASQRSKSQDGGRAHSAASTLTKRSTSVDRFCRLQNCAKEDLAKSSSYEYLVERLGMDPFVEREKTPGDKLMEESLAREQRREDKTELVSQREARGRAREARSTERQQRREQRSQSARKRQGRSRLEQAEETSRHPPASLVPECIRDQIPKEGLPTWVSGAERVLIQAQDGREAMDTLTDDVGSMTDKGQALRDTLQGAVEYFTDKTPRRPFHNGDELHEFVPFAPEDEAYVGDFGDRVGRDGLTPRICRAERDQLRERNLEQLEKDAKEDDAKKTAKSKTSKKARSRASAEGGSRDRSQAALWVLGNNSGGVSETVASPRRVKRQLTVHEEQSERMAADTRSPADRVRERHLLQQALHRRRPWYKRVLCCI